MTKKIAKRSYKKLATRRNLTIYNALRNEKDPLEHKDRRGVYRISFQDTQENEEKAYIE